MPTPAQSALPSAMQARRDRIAAEQAAQGVDDPMNNPPGNEPPQPAQLPAEQPPPQHQKPPQEQPPVHTPPQQQSAQPPQAPAAGIDAAEAQRMRDELAQATQRAQLLELQLAEARNNPPTPLTGAQEVPNGQSTPTPSPSASAFAATWDSAASAELDEQERTDYGEAEGAIRKVAGKVVADIVRKPFDTLAARLDTVERQLNNTETTVQRQASEGFIGVVKSRVPDFDALVNKPEWMTFLDGVVPYSGGLKFKQALANAHNTRNLDEIANIFEKFRGGNAPEPSTNSGYHSAPVSNVQEQPIVPAGQDEKLPFSERKQASEDFLKGRITREALDDISKKYNEAESKGLIDYTK